MQQPTTALDLYHAYQIARAELVQEQGSTPLRELPDSRDELSEEAKAIFESMAWKSNMIIGGFEAEQGK